MDRVKEYGDRLDSWGLEWEERRGEASISLELQVVLTLGCRVLAVRGWASSFSISSLPLWSPAPTVPYALKSGLGPSRNSEATLSLRVSSNLSVIKQEVTKGPCYELCLLDLSTRPLMHDRSWNRDVSRFKKGTT